MGWAAPIVEGYGKYQLAQGEAAQFKFNAKSEMIGADEEDALRRDDLLDTLSLTNAMRTSKGLQLGSPTGLAISQGMTKKAEAGISVARFNRFTRAQSDLFGQWGAEQKGSYALLGGFLEGYDQLSQDAAKAAAAGG